MMTIREQLIQEIEQAPDSLVEEVLSFLQAAKTKLSQTEHPSDQTRKPIWEVAEELIADIPPEVLEKLPRDGAAQHDHYLYGSPKRD
jgi:predicted  nucleic acid-binding Zn-ribbon protein